MLTSKGTIAKVLIRLWRDQWGAASTAGVIVIYTILALGCIVGLVIVRNQIVQELGDLAVAFDSLDQSYSVVTSSGTLSYTDAGTTLSDPSGQPPAGISVTSPAPRSEGGSSPVTTHDLGEE
jgi:hypothetical protein